MAPLCFRAGQKVPMSTSTFVSETGEENLLFAVASTFLSAEALSKTSSDLFYLDFADFMDRPRELKEALRGLPVRPVGLVAPELTVGMVCDAPSSVRFAVALGTATSPADLMRRWRPTNPDLLVFSLPANTTQADAAEKVSVFFQGGLESMDAWEGLYGVHNIADVEGILNLRDFGGYPTRDGMRVRRGIMYRSADLSPAPEQSLHALYWNLGIQHIHDLRSHPELQKKPYSIPEKLASDGKVVRYHTPVNAEEDYSPEALAQRFGLYSSGPLGFAKVYPAMAHRAHPVLLRLLSRFILPAYSSPNFLIHCTAGKDRTGILACLILTFLGVPDDLVARDYGASERLLLEGADPEVRAREWMENVGIPILGLTEDEWETKGKQAWENMRGTKPISMLKTIHALRVDYGPNIEGFYKKVLGLDDGDLAKLREEMLEDANEITKPQ